MMPGREKAEFVRAWIVRTAPGGRDEIALRVAQAEQAWAALEEIGYGPQEPPAAAPAPALSHWDGLPPARPAANASHPAYAPYAKVKPEPTREDQLRDEAHWREMLRRRPADPQILDVLNGVLAKLGRPALELPWADGG